MEKQELASHELRALRDELRALRDELRALRDELRALRTEQQEAQRALPPTRALTAEILQDMDEEDLDWRTSASIADAVAAPWSQVVTILQTLVVNCRIETKRIGAAVVYKALCDPETDLLRVLNAHPRGCTRKLLEEIVKDRVPECLIDGFLRSFLQEGKARLIGDAYRIVPPVPLEGVPPLPAESAA